MSHENQTLICQRCGRGFVSTSTYLNFLARRGVKVLVPVQCMKCFLNAGALDKRRGRVKWFSPRRGYGFIASEKGKDVFFHRNELLVYNGNIPQVGQTARFHVRHSAKGPEAVNVELTSE